MKVRSDNNDFLAKKRFIGRKNAKDFFWDNYKLCKCDSSKIRVINFCGVGGIGKSALIYNLIEEMETASKPIKFAYFDFSIKQDICSVLCYIKNQLISKYGFEFPLFELGLYIYNKKNWCEY